MRDIAKAAGVSLATVSRVLNQRDGVSPQNAARVMQTAQAMGYRTVGGQSLRSRGRTGNIGFLLVTAGVHRVEANEFYGVILDGVHRAAQEAAYRVVYATCDEPPDGIPATLVDQVDLVLVVGWRPELDLERLLASRTPIVLVDAWHDGLTHDAVVIDNAGGMRAAVRHLYERGARRLALIGGPPSNPSFGARRSAFFGTLAELGLCTHGEVDGDPTINGGYGAAERLWSGAVDDRHPDGICFANDAMAVGGLRWLGEQQIAVPDAVRVVGFDDILLAQQLTPALSTIRVPKQKLGELAVELGLRKMRDAEHVPVRMTVGTELVQRETT